MISLVLACQLAAVLRVNSSAVTTSVTYDFPYGVNQ